jgi:hypothetical protein
MDPETATEEVTPAAIQGKRVRQVVIPKTKNPLLEGAKI